MVTFCYGSSGVHTFFPPPPINLEFSPSKARQFEILRFSGLVYLGIRFSLKVDDMVRRGQDFGPCMAPCPLERPVLKISHLVQVEPETSISAYFVSRPSGGRGTTFGEILSWVVRGNHILLHPPVPTKTRICVKLFTTSAGTTPNITGS